MGGVFMCLYVCGAQSEVLSDGAGKLPMWRKWSKKKGGEYQDSKRRGREEGVN